MPSFQRDPTLLVFFNGWPRWASRRQVWHLVLLILVVLLLLHLVILIVFHLFSAWIQLARFALMFLFLGNMYILMCCPTPVGWLEKMLRGLVAEGHVCSATLARLPEPALSAFSAIEPSVRIVLCDFGMPWTKPWLR